MDYTNAIQDKLNCNAQEIFLINTFFVIRIKMAALYSDFAQVWLLVVRLSYDCIKSVCPRLLNNVSIIVNQDMKRHIKYTSTGVRKRELLGELETLARKIILEKIGYTPKKLNIFNSPSLGVDKFLKTAPLGFLPQKVALIIGISGVCRSDELFRMKINDMEMTEKDSHHNSRYENLSSLKICNNGFEMDFHIKRMHTSTYLMQVHTYVIEESLGNHMDIIQSANSPRK
ncbi:hypothetical protein NQ317_014964 [Molorchus minor]|uniref:Uncharacterized protein n=1 Tax=Molorchus minor TaxID=1323400 RepID=A0ABQ9JNK8_9CUCU|nr:hypothetical protein NQ317_014964 [Molorchus minor]